MLNKSSPLAIQLDICQCEICLTFTKNSKMRIILRFGLDLYLKEV